MKRWTRVALVCCVLAALVLCSAFAVDRAVAAGGLQESAAAAQRKKASEPSDAVNKWKDIDWKALEAQADQGDQQDVTDDPTGKDGQGSGDEQMASSTTYIKKDTTISSKKTYNSNVILNPYVRLTIKNGATVTINGDLVIGGDVEIPDGNLIVNGDIIDYAGLGVYGSSSVTVNKAKKVIKKNGYTYFGGNLVVSNDYGLSAELSMEDEAYIEVTESEDGGFFTQYSGLLSMQGQTKIKVNDRCYLGGSSRISCGTTDQEELEIVDGAFYVEGAAFYPYGSLTVKLTATISNPRYVYFDAPDYSYLYKFKDDGVVYDPNSVISLCAGARSTYTFDHCKVYLKGSLTGNTTIDASLVVPGPRFNGYTLTINGNLADELDHYLGMNNANDTIHINGNSIIHYVYYMTAGQIEANGDLVLDNTSYYGGGFPQQVAIKVFGANRRVSFPNPEITYCSNFQLTLGASLDFASVISLRCDLSEPSNWNISKLYYSGNLNGYCMTQSGDFVTNGPTTIGTGRLKVGGCLEVKGPLNMNDPNGEVQVSGNVSVDVSTSSLTAGKLYIAGNFTQKGNSNHNIFEASDSHVLILDGIGTQNLSFEAPSSKCKFAHVVLLNDSMSPNDIPAGYFDDILVSGMTLSSVSVDSGCTAIKSPDPSYDYLILLPEDKTSVTITPQLVHDNSWMTADKDSADPITSITVSDVPLNGYATGTVTVHAVQDLEKREHKFKVERIDAYLGSLGALPDGSKVDQDFDKDTAAYTVQLPETAASFTFAPQADNPDSTVSVCEHCPSPDSSASPTATVALAPGGSKTYNVAVKAQDGSTEKVYTVLFHRRQPVSGITVSDGTLTFSADTAAYDVYVPAATASVDVSVIKTADDCSEIHINGGKQPGNTLALTPAAGGTATATVEAWDADGASKTAYTVTVHRVAALSDIDLSTGSLSPAFDPALPAYAVYVPSSTASVTVTPQLTPGQTATINGQAVPSLVLAPPAGGSASAEIVCTGQGVIQTYTVTVWRVMPVSMVAVSAGKLSPAFSAGVTSYSDNVKATVASVTVSVTKTPSLVSLTVNGAPAAFDGSGVATALVSPAVGGSAQAVIRATAQDGRDYTYTVTVSRDTLIKSIKTSAGTLTPAYSPTVTTYSVVNVPATTASVKISVTKASGVKSVKINGKSATSVTVKPPVGGSAPPVSIVATASDGVTQVAYSVTVTRNGLLSGIALSDGALSPAFSTAVSAYTVTLAADDANPVVITPALAAGAKTLLINGVKQASVSLSPAMGGSAVATIVVTASDNKTTQTFTVTVVRLAG